MSHHPVVSFHLDAFTKHSRWVPKLEQWSVLAQAAMLDENNAMDSGTDDNVFGLVASWTSRWRNSRSGEATKTLFTEIARGMGLVSKRMGRTVIAEKELRAVQSLASGELSPAVVEMISVSRSEGNQHQSLAEGQKPVHTTTVIDLSTPPGDNRPAIQQHAKKPASNKKTIMDYLKFNDSPPSSDVEYLPSTEKTTSHSSIETQHRSNNTTASTTPTNKNALASTAKPWIAKKLNKGGFDFFSHSKRFDAARKAGGEQQR